MSDPADPPPQPTAFAAAAAWLESAPATDPVAELPLLRQHLRALVDGDVPVPRLLELLAELLPRAAAAEHAARPHLLRTTLPLPRQLRSLAKALIDCEGVLAKSLMRIARDADAADLAAAGARRADIIASALSHLATQLEATLLTSLPTPPALWSLAQRLYYMTYGYTSAQAPAPGHGGSAELTLKIMLAMATSHAEAHTPRQFDFLVRFARRHAAKVELRIVPPGDVATWHWLEESRDLPPVAANRRSPPSDGRVLYFSCADLAAACTAALDRFSRGKPDPRDLPDAADAVDISGALRQSRNYWSSPPRGIQTRRLGSYAVEMCIDFARLWRQLNGDVEADGLEPGGAAVSWTVVNESAGGYAVMNVGGGISGIQSGSAVGLRNGADHPWSICLVRWARSDNPDHVELGLEVISPTAQAVRVANRKTGASQPALLLPFPSQLDRAESILAPRGSYAVSAFTMIQDIAGRVRISYCIPQDLWIQTSSVEAYGFERDPMPL